MKKILFLLAALFVSASLFSQSDTARSKTKPNPFGESVSISLDSIKKLPINDQLIGKWVLISSKIKEGHDEDMLPWDIQTIEFKSDRTLTINPGPYLRKTYWSFVERDAMIAIFTTEEGNKLVRRVQFPILKMSKDVLKTTEWINIKPVGERYQKLTFLKIE